MKYSDRKKQAKYYVVLEGTTVLGVFKTLKKACEYMKNKDFPSYWTLVREDFTRKDHKNYSIQQLPVQK